MKMHVATHAALFEAETTPRAECHVCGTSVDTEAEEGFSVTGRGLLLWVRGGERRYEEPSLCPTCGAAIGVMAQAHWDIEEEEG